MKCPKCESQLNKVKVTTRPEYGGDVLNDAEQTSEIELDQCLSCNGIWFDADELEQYLAEKILILDSPKTSNSRELNKKEGSCPRCEKVMKREPSPKGEVIMDVCKECNGVWLDSGELDKMEAKNLSLGEKSALNMREFIRGVKKMFGKE